MSNLDWVILIGTLAFIVIYGVWVTRRKAERDSDDFLAGRRDLPWWTIGLSIMATQASAITFLSTPGQGFSDGMEFVQFYFGMPIAVVILAYFVVPIYYRLRVTTAYEYLEQRFDLRMRALTAVLFLIQRGVAAAISIYAPSIILCAVFGWSLPLTNLMMATFVVIYTTSGGSAAVSRTQELQMSIMLGGLVLAFLLILNALPDGVGLSEAWRTAGFMGKTKVIDTKFDWDDRYNLWSGLLGSTFLFLSYFGTDQSQVGRYLSGKTLKESRFGLLFNGFVKIPLQFLVLSVGVMTFVFYLFHQMPLHFNQSNLDQARAAGQSVVIDRLEQINQTVNTYRADWATQLVGAADQPDPTALEQVKALERQRHALGLQAKEIIAQTNPDADTKDKDFVFISYILSHIPHGLVGLMLAMIFCASWSTTASELNALTATSVSDIYRRILAPGRDESHYLWVSKGATVMWGVFITIFATFADLFENLIQAVNMVGSIFYGTILGIFFTAFFLKKVGGRSVFRAAVLTQGIVALLFFGVDRDAYLWYNPLGCGLVMGFSLLHEWLWPKKKNVDPSIQTLQLPA